MKKAPSIKLFSQSLGIGIDISKANLAIAGLTNNDWLYKSIANKKQSLRRFAKILSEAGYENKIICESTGHYHLKLAVVCEEFGLNLLVLNPLQASKHSKAKIRKVKTDPEDSYTLATMCLTERNLPEPAHITLPKALIRLKMGQLASLEKQLQKMSQSLNQYEETYRELGLELSETQQALREQQCTLKGLQKQFRKELDALLIEAIPDKKDFENLCSVPGFSNNVSGLVGNLRRDVKSADSWVAFIGYDVSIRESGIWKGRGKLTKRGNAYLRKRMFQAAWGACLSYDYMRTYYDKLKEDGRNHVEAVCMIARKLLRIAYHVVMNKTPFDKNKSVFG